MVNEFHNLDLVCVTPQLVPPYGNPANQGCSLPGSIAGSHTVDGEAYLEAQLHYSYSHLWRNVGIILAFWAFFTLMTVVGMERTLKAPKGGGTMNIFKKGGAPKYVQQVLSGKVTGDEEAQRGDLVIDNVKERPKMESQFLGIAKTNGFFTWSGLRCVIQADATQKVLLDNVSGYVKPGRMTALMGGTRTCIRTLIIESGAGKTTLLNCLAQRMSTGVVTGQILIDGRPLPRSFQRSTGYVEQFDVSEPTATVREALRFYALLRRPKSVAIQEKYAYVEEVIKLLELEEVAEAIIGTDGMGLASEPRKRLTIAMELASKPDLLLFLDEPTSGTQVHSQLLTKGLDSQGAFNIIRLLRRLCDSGQAILCTLHQPSAVLFGYFDELLLLQAGGQTTYFGPLGAKSETLINYFERNGPLKCKKDVNPAEYDLVLLR
jgi:ATP-binding cassette, subfamily G (WHITE), member 2, PDR